MKDNAAHILLMVEQGVKEHGKEITRQMVKIWSKRAGRQRPAIQHLEKIALELIDAL